MSARAPVPPPSSGKPAPPPEPPRRIRRRIDPQDVIGFGSGILPDGERLCVHSKAMVEAVHEVLDGVPEYSDEQGYVNMVVSLASRDPAVLAAWGAALEAGAKKLTDHIRREAAREALDLRHRASSLDRLAGASDA